MTSGPRSVVIADDVAAMRMLLRTTLEDDGRFEVVAEAGDGRAALDAASAVRPDVMVLDVAMPVMDGLEVLAELERAGVGTKVLVLSGFAADAMEARAVARGAHAFLHKSTPLGEVAAALARLCDAAPAGAAVVDVRASSDAEASQTGVERATPATEASRRADGARPKGSAARRARAGDDAPRQDVLALLSMVATAANETESLEDVLELTLGRVCRWGGWAVGTAYVARDGGRLEASGVWHVDDHDRFDVFRRVSDELTFESGVGLPGEVLERRRAVWIDDLDAQTFLRSAVARQAGLRCALAFPILAGRDIAGVVELFGDERAEPDDDVVEVMSQIGAQLGRVAERRASRAALAASAEDLARSNAELEQFAYAASHDLQEPLRVAAGYLELLDRRHGAEMDDVARSYVGHASDAANRMRDLIADLLALSRVGTRGGAFENVSLHDVARIAIANVDASIHDTKARVTTGDLPVVRGDHAQLVQLLQNLLSNAIKFRRGDEARVHVSARTCVDRCVVTVEDDGIGIEERFAERVFEPFHRLHTSSEYPGTGMGLAICRRIAERHGGAIWYEPNPGGGSRFSFAVARREVAL
ncbi:MAG TPA: ATP-binding protein [Actinomycetota bacterium]|nr:ATP-binding protein [Actinomycetota bacterium]